MIWIGPMDSGDLGNNGNIEFFIGVSSFNSNAFINTYCRLSLPVYYHCKTSVLHNLFGPTHLATTSCAVPIYDPMIHILYLYVFTFS